MLPTEITHWHRTLPGEPTIGVKVERHSRGINYEVSIQNASSLTQALGILDEALKTLDQRFYPPTIPTASQEVK